MRKLFVLALAAGLLMSLMPSAQAAVETTGRNGKNYEFRECFGQFAPSPSFCQYTPYTNGDLKIHTEYARAEVWYEIPRPDANAQADTMTWIVDDLGNCNAANAKAVWIGQNQNFATVVFKSGKKLTPVNNCRLIRINIKWTGVLS